MQISQTLLTLDPGNIVSTNNMGVAHQGVGDALWAMGRMREAIPNYLKCLDDFGKATSGGTGFVIIHGYAVAQTASHQAQLGDDAGSGRDYCVGRAVSGRLAPQRAAGQRRRGHCRFAGGSSHCVRRI